MIEELPGRIEKALAGLLVKDEAVLWKIKGNNKEGLICTDKRVMIIKGGFMTGQTFGTNTFQLLYQQITGVDVKYKWVSGYFEISAGGMQNTDKRKIQEASEAPNCVSVMGEAQAKKFRDAAGFILSRQQELLYGANLAAAATVAPKVSSNHDDIFSLLENLGTLRDKGVITEEDFQAKKAELLARL